MKKGRGDDDKQDVDPQKDLQDYVDLMFVDDLSPEVKVEKVKAENVKTVPVSVKSAEVNPASVKPEKLKTAKNQQKTVMAPSSPVKPASISPLQSNRLDIPPSVPRVQNQLHKHSVKKNLPLHKEKVQNRIRNAESLERKLVRERVKNLTQGMRQAADAEQAQKIKPPIVPEKVKPAVVARVPSGEPATSSPDKSAPLISQPVKEDVPVSGSEDPAPYQVWCENGRPQWAQEAFECLLFKVAGLTMAVPLVELGSIHPITDELTAIFGQADWFIGLMSVSAGNIRTVNTARIVMPERYDDKFVDNIGYVISINGYDWGLAVDCVDKAITLDPEAVRWRTSRSKRPWLAGTVVEYMCALLDVQAMAQMLNQSDRHLSH